MIEFNILIKGLPLPVLHILSELVGRCCEGSENVGRRKKEEGRGRHQEDQPIRAKEGMKIALRK